MLVLTNVHDHKKGLVLPGGLLLRTCIHTPFFLYIHIANNRLRVSDSAVDAPQAKLLNPSINQSHETQKLNMSNTGTFTFPKVEFPVLNTQGSNYARWLESLQASIHVKVHEHYQYSRFIEKPYLTEATAGFKTLESARKNKHDAFSSRTASAEPSRRATRSEQSDQESEQQSQTEE